MRRKTRKRKGRKSPYKHKVHRHTRKGKVIEEYDRGLGPKPRASPRRARLKGEPKRALVSKRGSTNHHVIVEYGDRSKDHVNVEAPNFVSALDQGIEQREKYKPPLIVTIRRE